jgi:hypothetical protein
MNYEKKMIREKDVKFDGEDGSLELTDVRLVWIKKPSKWGGMGKFGGIAAAVGGAIAADIIGNSVGGVAGHAIRRTGRTVAYASIGAAVTSWTMDSYYNKDKNGNTETIALPLVAISQATQSGKKLIVELKSGGNMQFEFKQKKVIPSVVANVNSAQSEGSILPRARASAHTAAPLHRMPQHVRSVERHSKAEEGHQLKAGVKLSTSTCPQREAVDSVGSVVSHCPRVPSSAASVDNRSRTLFGQRKRSSLFGRGIPLLLSEPSSYS